MRGTLSIQDQRQRALDNVLMAYSVGGSGALLAVAGIVGSLELPTLGAAATVLGFSLVAGSALFFLPLARYLACFGSLSAAVVAHGTVVSGVFGSAAWLACLAYLWAAQSGTGLLSVEIKTLSAIATVLLTITVACSLGTAAFDLVTGVSIGRGPTALTPDRRTNTSARIREAPPVS